MIRSQRKLSELASVLEKRDNMVIAQAIEMLREQEPFEGAVNQLINCYDHNSDPSVRKAIEGFMNDIKDKELQPEVISEIRKERKPATLSMLVSSCWQSGLDYSFFSFDFAEIFLKSDYATAIECFTVIEESAHLLERAEKARIIELIESGAIPEEDSKKMLTLQLITVLEA
jgi:predicted DNA-binding protein